ncbi:PfkB family carbohydrate kinase [Kitasatospora atroaurantiaca]|uniref:Sugar/nucleoside kinase (Ribokinase family) n=1 Tax=Kitasatospora atroaurantiaca TaxID=285545 RepID=A0A561F052_9ACTN|nr:PfkB family carbohydrate kinase [Kitasatospora atroaurantiaca]TWE21192.1 sugar/nucleoside kinase (ribokinase family) [Kitasatospora atroaurantiaca]
MTGGGALLVIGDVVTDIVALHGRPLTPHTDTAARISVRPGGSAANTASWAAHAGAEARLLARVGADSADWHRAELLAAGVRPQLVVDAELRTAVVIALVDTAAERTFVTDGGAAVRLGPEDWAPSLLDGVARVHLSGYLFFADPGRRLAALAIAAATARGLPVSVDPASTGFIEQLGVTAFLDAIGGTDLLLPNLAEATLLAGTDHPVAAAERLSAAHGEAVVKLGPQGALAARQGTVVAHVPGMAASAVDSTGAGDAFTGGFLAARLAGAGLAEAAAAGCRTGATAVAEVGGRPPRRRGR